LSIGFEKIVINSEAYKNPSILTELADHFGAQAVIGSIDVKKNVWGRYTVYVKDGSEKTSLDPVEWAQKMKEHGAGEILLTSMDRDGTWAGFDVELTRKVAEAISIPVIANGGAGTIAHIGDVVKNGHASAVSLGSMVVYQKKEMGVLVNFPDKTELEKILA
jgi:cyclase